MSAMAEKLKAAGVDTLGARLTAMCIEAIRHHPESVVDAWRYAGAIFGHEFVRGLMADIKQPKKEPRSPPTPLSRDDHPIASPKPYTPRVIPPERLEKRRALQKIVRSKYKNSGGIAWSDVGWHELNGLQRDGAEARALLSAGPANVTTNASVGDILGIAKVDEIIANVRANAKAGE